MSVAAVGLVLYISWPEKGVSRLVVPLVDPGPGVPFDLSPDGEELVYVSRASGRNAIYVRPVDGFESTPIADAFGGSPFFSPDGDWVGFLSDGVLKKVHVDGGPVTAVSDNVVFGARGASWGEDGSVVIVGGGFGPLYRVDSRGGDAETFTRIRAEDGELAHMWPQVLPGGEWVLFTNVERMGSDNPIVAESLLTGERREIHRGGTSPRYANGFLIYANAGTLLAVRFDPDTLDVASEPVVVLEGVDARDYDGRTRFRVASDGTLAYVPARPTPRQWLAWYRRDGRGEPVDVPLLTSRLESAGRIATPRLSPDGRRLAVSVGDQAGTGRADIWLYDLERGTEERLSDEDFVSYLEWSPDGAAIAYWAVGQGGYSTVVREVHRVGQATTLYRTPFLHWPLDWLPERRGLLLLQVHDTNFLDIMLLSSEVPDAAPEVLIGSSRQEDNAKVSPDGSLLAYQQVDADERNVYICTFPELDFRQRVSRSSGFEPLWSPDGSELYFKTTDYKRIMVVDVYREPELDVSEPRVLFEGNFPQLPGGPTNYDVTPDGERFLMVEEEELPDAPPQIHIVLGWLDEVEEKVAAANR